MTNASLADLALIVGQSNVLRGSDTAGYVTDWRGRYEGTALAVVRPGSTTEVAACVRWAYEHGIPVVPQGGNTGMCGGSVPDGSGTQLVISLSRMNHVRQADAVNNTMIVEAGCVLATIQAEAAALGRHFPMGLGSEGSCQIGGNISTNSGGIEVLRYGPMRDLVLGLEVVLPDGSLFDGLYRLRKNNAGYDLKHLFIGAEGTLGIITAAVLKLFPADRASAVALAGLKQIDPALTLLSRAKEMFGQRIAAFEIISDSQVELVHRSTELRLPMDERKPWYVLIHVGDSDASAPLAERLEELLGEALADGLIDDVVVPQSGAQSQLLWDIRHAVADANRAAGMVLSHDTSVPTSATAEFVREVDAQISGLLEHVFPVYVGHLGDGNVHVAVIFPRDKYSKAEFEGLAGSVNDRIYQISAALGGSISAEHGIGQSLRTKLPLYKDPVQVALMKTVKTALDPRNLMNPGKVLQIG